MSKIQIAQLNETASEFTALNDSETADVVGGYGYYGGYYSDKYANVYQNNSNETTQVAFGGYYGDINQNNSTNQSNSANIYQ
jgi:hypothetical protein